MGSHGYASEACKASVRVVDVLQLYCGYSLIRAVAKQNRAGGKCSKVFKRPPLSTLAKIGFENSLE